MKLLRTGVTRWVILTGKYAIKFPSFHSYRHFLQGILGNNQEAYWYKNLKCDKLCPVLFSSWFNLILIMPRCKILTRPEFDHIDLEAFIKIDENYSIPAEAKMDSFGYLGDKLVCVDYGS